MFLIKFYKNFLTIALLLFQTFPDETVPRKNFRIVSQMSILYRKLCKQV